MQLQYRPDPSPILVALVWIATIYIGVAAAMKLTGTVDITWGMVFLPAIALGFVLAVLVVAGLAIGAIYMAIVWVDEALERREYRRLNAERIDRQGAMAAHPSAGNRPSA